MTVQPGDVQWDFNPWALCRPSYHICTWSSRGQRNNKKALSSQVLRAEEASSTSLNILTWWCPWDGTRKCGSPVRQHQRRCPSWHHCLPVRRAPISSTHGTCSFSITSPQLSEGKLEYRQGQLFLIAVWFFVCCCCCFNFHLNPREPSTHLPLEFQIKKRYREQYWSLRKLPKHHKPGIPSWWADFLSLRNVLSSRVSLRTYSYKKKVTNTYYISGTYYNGCQEQDRKLPSWSTFSPSFLLTGQQMIAAA